MSDVFFFLWSESVMFGRACSCALANLLLFSFSLFLSLFLSLSTEHVNFSNPSYLSARNIT